MANWYESAWRNSHGSRQEAQRRQAQRSHIPIPTNRNRHADRRTQSLYPCRETKHNQDPLTNRGMGDHTIAAPCTKALHRARIGSSPCNAESPVPLPSEQQAPRRDHRRRGTTTPAVGGTREWSARERPLGERPPYKAPPCRIQGRSPMGAIRYLAQGPSPWPPRGRLQRGSTKRLASAPFDGPPFP